MIRWYHADPTYLLERKTEGASGYDVACVLSAAREVPPHGRWVFSTGLHLEIPLGLEGQIRSRSGLARDHGLVVAPGTIDSDYRGEVMVTLFNHGSTGYIVNPGDRIAQLVFGPVWPQIWELLDKLEEADQAMVGAGSRLSKAQLMLVERVQRLDDLNETERGVKGHGSTGR